MNEFFLGFAIGFLSAIAVTVSTIMILIPLFKKRLKGWVKKWE